MLRSKPLEIAERIAVFCLLSALVLWLTADNILGRAGLQATFVPQFFRLKSLPATSRSEMLSGREEAAVSTARAAVLNQPLSVDALLVLAQSTAVSNPRVSLEALAQAAGLGWRNPTVQAMVIESAALTNNWDVVAPRLLALAILNMLDVIDAASFARGDAPDYAVRIAPAFSDNGLAWFKFAKWLRDKGLNGESDAVLSQTPRYEREDACDRLRLTANELVRAGRVDFAAGLVDTRCRNFLTSASSTLAIDEHFGDRDRGPFEWQVVGQSGVSVRLEITNGMTFVEVENSDPLPRTIARKMVSAKVVQSGPVLNFKKIGSSRSSQESLPLEFECAKFQQNQRFKAMLSSTKKLTEGCLFVRAKFDLPTGRFRLWTD